MHIDEYVPLKEGSMGESTQKIKTNPKLRKIEDHFKQSFDEVGLNIQKHRVYKVKPDGACGSNCVALRYHEDETMGQYVRRNINEYIVDHWEYQRKFMVFPHTQMVGGKEITFEEQEYLHFLRHSNESGRLWMDYTDLQAVANHYQVTIHV